MVSRTAGFVHREDVVPRLEGTVVAVLGFSVVIPVLIRPRMSPTWRALLEHRKRRIIERVLSRFAQ